MSSQALPVPRKMRRSENISPQHSASVRGFSLQCSEIKTSRPLRALRITPSSCATRREASPGDTLINSASLRLLTGSPARKRAAKVGQVESDHPIK